MAYQYEDTIQSILDERKKKREDDARSGWDKFWGGVGDTTKNVGDFVGDVLQSIPRSVANIGATLQQSGRDMNLDSSDKTIDRILSIDPERRKKLLKDVKDPEASRKLSDQDWADAVFISKAQDTLGSIDDETLKKRKVSNAEERSKDITYKPDNAVAKFFLGGENDEVVQSAQKSNKDIAKWGLEQGLDKGQAGALGFVGAVAGTALDAPTGVGSLVKTPLKEVGKSGVKKLVEATTEDSAKAILKKKIPKITDEALNNLAPQLVQAADKKSVQAILKAQDYKTLTGVKAVADAGATSATGQTAREAGTGALDNATGATAPALTDGASDLATRTAADVADGTPGLSLDATQNAVKEATINTSGRVPKRTSYGDAADELLGNVKNSSEIDAKKPGLKDRFKAEWVDKLSPVNDFVKQVEERTGRKLTTEDNPYELMRLYNGMPDQVQQRIRGLTDIIKQAPDLDAVRIIGLGRQVQARAGKGVNSFISPERAGEAINQVQTKIGARRFDEASRVVDEIVKYNNNLLEDLHKAGIISDDALKAIDENVSKNYFARFNVVNHILENDANRALFSKTGSYNVTQQTKKKIIASLKGMEEGTQILDPFESLVKSTDSAMRAIAKNDIWHAFNRMADEVPDLVTRIRTPDDVAQRIALSLDNKELRPLRNKIDSLIKTRGRWVRQLQSQINQLEKKGLQTSLKQGGERMTADTFVDAARLGGKVPTSQIGKEGATTVRQGDETVKGFMDVVNPQKLGSSDTAKFVRNLIEKGGQKEIDRLKKMVGSRDEKLVKLLDDIGAMRSEYDDIAGKMAQNTGKIKELAGQEVPEGMALISGFGKGIQGKLAVPKEIADVFTGKTAAQQDYLTGVFGGVNKFIKSALTSNNPVFALVTNPTRDAKTFAYNSRTTSSNPVHVGYALAMGVFDAVAGRMGKSDIYARWVASGGRSGFYADERAAADMARDLSRTVNGKRVLGVKVAPVNNAKDFIREAARVISTPIRVPLKGLRGAAGILEDAPRLAEFRGAIKKGATDKNAAFLSRNVTVDFQQAGQHAQVVNAWVPFLNARFQGTLKSVDAIKSNPARAASVYATMTATPILLTAYNNYVRFPEVTKMLSEDERANNFVIVLGDAQDEEGNYTQVIKIPKSDIDKVLGNPLEQVARFVAQDDPQTLGEVLTNMVGSLTPVDTVRDNQFSAERAASGVIPAPLKIPLESAANRSFYFGSDLVGRGKQDLPPEMQVNDSTTGAAKFIGAITGSSPIKVDNTLGNLGLRTSAKLLDNPSEPFSSKLTGSTGNRMNDEFYDIMDETSKNYARANAYINEMIAAGNIAAAQETAANYNAYLKKKFAPLNERYAGQITEAMVEQYNDRKFNLTKASIKQRRRNALKKEAEGK